MKTSLLLIAIAAPAFADEVQLRDGRKLSACIATEKGNRVEVELGSGRIDFDKKDVMSIKPLPCPLKEYPAKFEVAKGKAAALFELAGWCKQNGVVRHVRSLLEEVIKLDPGHAAARKELGYQKVDGKWLAGDALKKAQGYVKVDGAWMTPIEAELQKSKKIAAKSRALDEAEELENRRLEAESARLLEESRSAERAEEQRRRAEQERESRRRRWYNNPWYGPYGGYSVLGTLGFVPGGWTIPTIPYFTSWPIFPKPKSNGTTTTAPGGTKCTVETQPRTTPMPGP